MVWSSNVEEGTHILPAGVRQILKSIKEVVGNHSYGDIYVALRETKMDPNETVQKLLNQDPFHEVKRKRDRKKENPVSTSFTTAEIRSNIEHGAEKTRFNTYSDPNIRRQSYSRATLPDAGASPEFRVVRDNRINQNSNREIKPVQTSTSAEAVISGVPMKRLMKPNGSLPHSRSDPVHVPSLESRPAGKVSSLKREVGVLGARRQSAESFTKSPSSQSISFSNSQMGQVRPGGTNSKGSLRPLSSSSRSNQSAVSDPPKSSLPVIRSFLINQHINRGHQKALRWKPKLNQKPFVTGPGVSGTPSESLKGGSEDLEKDESQLQDKVARLSISDNVIIAAHICVSEADRNRLTFGSLDADLTSGHNPVSEADQNRLIFGSLDADITYSKDLGEESHTESPSASLSILVTGPLSDEQVGGEQVDMVNDCVQNSGSKSPGSGANLDQMTDKRDSFNAQHLEYYSNVGLVQDNSASYTPSESQERQDAPDSPRFAGYDPQIGYNIPYFRPAVDDSACGQGAQEALGTHATNSIPASSIPMLQHVQQSQHVAQMYPQVHASHFANLMPYRHLVSPIYVPPMAMPGYSSNPAYAHPSSGSNYLMMPRNSSHLSGNGHTYGIQQFKPVPTGSAPVFENFTSPTGYAINAPGVIGSAIGLEHSSQLKYKDNNLYVPNQQAETSEMWISPRDLPAFRSDSYYNMAGLTHHAAYVPSHTGYGSFNAAPDAAQSSHMQFQGLYHHLQPAMENPQHLGNAMADNVGARGVQVDAYQQPQLSHLNWNGNF